jgi:hypothetical protein
LPPAFREILKEAHEGLTDAEIDRVELLLSQRFLLDPSRDPERLRALDRERERLIEERMPDFEELWVRYCESEAPREEDAESGP